MFLVELLLFIFLALICFTYPGYLILSLSDHKFRFWEKTTLSTIVGFTLFTVIGYLLLFINLQILIIPVVIALSILATIQIIKKEEKLTFFPKEKLILFTFVLTVGVTGQLAVIAPSGIYRGSDLVFWSAHGHDAPWHIALMNDIQKGYPMQNPVYAGEKLANYHFFSDIAPAYFNKFLSINALDLYFRFFPLLYSLLFGGISYLLGEKLGGKFLAGLWAMIFSYFAGSFGFIVTLLQHRGIGGESLFWSSQPQSTIGNPPQIAASILLLGFLYFLYLYLQKKDWIVYGICILIVGSLIEFKVYAGIVALGSLGFIGVLELIFKRKLYLLSMFLLSTLCSLFYYLPNSSATTSFLIFEPWWYIRTMVVATDKLNWIDLELRRQTYLSEQNYKRVLQLEVIAFLIFFIGNLGTRIVSIYYLGTNLKKIFSDNTYIFMISALIISFIIPMLFLQKGVASNTSQFFQYFLLITGIFAGVSLTLILKKFKSLWIKSIIILIIVIFSVPTQLGLIYSFYSKNPTSRVSSEELSALRFLKSNTNPNDVVLTPLYNKYLNLPTDIPTIWDWYDTAYVSAISSRRVFLADFEQVDIMGYDLETRRQVVDTIFKEEDPKNFESELLRNSIKVVYFPSELKPSVNLEKTNLKKIYASKKVEVWLVR